MKSVEEWERILYGIPSTFDENTIEERMEVVRQIRREAFNAAKLGTIEKVPVVIDQYGGTNIEEHFVAKYSTFEDWEAEQTTFEQFEEGKDKI